MKNKINKNFTLSTIALLLASPVLVFAQDKGLLSTVGGLMNTFTTLIFSAAILFFFWNLMMYIFKQGDEKNDASSGMIWGIVILFVMTSVYGLVYLLSETVGIEDNKNSPDNFKIPTVPAVKSGTK